jgi:hypothetical protein
MADQQLAGQPAGAAAATADSYAAAFPGGITDAERRRLDLQTELYGRLSAWTLDALGLGLGPGQPAVLPRPEWHEPEPLPRTVTARAHRAERARQLRANGLPWQRSGHPRRENFQLCAGQ